MIVLDIRMIVLDICMIVLEGQDFGGGVLWRL